MRKLHLALLLTSSSLLITSCQNNQKVNEAVYSSTDGETNRDSTDRDGEPPISDSVCLSINCDDGCLVSVDQEHYQKSYIAYVPFESELRFNFRKTNEDYDFPSLLSAVNDNTSYNKNTFTYNYSADNGVLTFQVPESSKNVNKITFEANTLNPAVEFRFERAGGQEVPIQLSYSGSVKAVDFGDGRVKDASQFQSGVIQGKVIMNSDYNGYMKIYGNCSSLSFNESDALNYLTDISFNHDIESFDYMMFGMCRAVKRLYIGPDIKEMIFLPEYVELIMAGKLSARNLERIEVSEDNPYLDSRDDCGCLIDSKTNKLLLGAGEGFIPNGITSIGQCAFFDCRSLDYLNIPDSITDIEAYAFSRSSVSYLELPANLKTVGKSAFMECNNLGYVDFSRLSHAPYMMFSCFEKSACLRSPDGVRPFVHANPSDMANIVQELRLYDELWGIEGDRLFANDVNLLPSFVCVNKLHKDLERTETTHMEFSSEDADSKKSFGAVLTGEQGSRVEWGDHQITAGIQYDPNYMSSYCTAVYAKKYDDTPAHVDPIFCGHGEPYGDNGLDIIFIKYFTYYGGNDSNNRIGEYTFYKLAALKHFEFTERVSIKGDVLPYSLITEIGKYAFANTGITSIELPSSLITIDDGAFMNCANLKELTFDKIGRVYQEGLPEQEEYKNYLNLHSHVFAGDTGIEKLDFPWFIDFFSNEMKEIVPSNPFIGCTSIKSITCADREMYPYTKYVFESSEERPGCLIRMSDGMCICCVSNINRLIQGRLADGFYGTTTMPYIEANYKGMVAPQAYSFAYSVAKRIKLLNNTNRCFIQPYMFAYCPNLEVVDLRDLGNPLEEGTFGQEDAPFIGTNENFKIWVNSEEEKGMYGKMFHFTDEYRDAHIVVIP